MNRIRVIMITSGLLLVLVSLCAVVHAQQDASGSVTGVVKDSKGALIPGARVLLIQTQQAVLESTTSGTDGRFGFENVLPGTYELRVSREDFSTNRVPLQVRAGGNPDIQITLEVGQLSDEVTVTAEAGQVQGKNRVAQSVNVISEEALRQRTTDVLAQVADEEVGLSLQRTSPTIGAIFVRGLTGKNVAVYVDGVRYTTASGRGGINTFFNLNEPGDLAAVEVLRGPNSAQFGSDSLGGTVSLISRSPVFGGDKPEFHGEINTFFSSADSSFGGNSIFNYGSKRYGIYGNIASRRVNTLRAANGLDGHAAVTRFLGLPSDVLGERLKDTAYTGYSGTLHLNYLLTANQQLVFHYHRGQQDGGKRYDQLLGGDGNLVADLRNLMLDFFFGRYMKKGVGFFDNASLTFSYNSQREERVNQGGQGNPRGAVTHQYERTNVYGLSFFLDKQLTRENTFLVGGDLYHERVIAPAYTFSPVSGLSTASRPRVPNGARYLSFGGYVQDVYEAIPERLRISGALRYSVASYLSKSSNSPTVNGQPLFPDDSLRVSNFSGRIGSVFTPIRELGISFNYSRGFRAPNITDLGTLGLTGDGFEVDYASAAALGGTIGTSASSNAVSTGVPVSPQESEVSNNFDLGLRFHKGWFDSSVTGFVIDINNAIVKQALILPPGAVGHLLGGQPIVAQLPNGTVFVPVSTSPVLARVNFTDARIFGLEYTMDARLSPNWLLAGNFTYIRARDKATGLPPNIEGGTPLPTGFIRLRYEPAGSHFWIEGYSTLAARQSRLSSLDLTDRRTGGTRSRTQIANFFRNGACVYGLVAPGPDGRCATGDETILLATGETLAEVQNRVLGTATSAPLFTYLPGYGLFNVRGGFRVNENSEFDFDFKNIGDKSYRGPSWGIDGPGRSVNFRYRYRF